jgi:ABC-2 type transport system ATP-binding protein
MIEIKNLNFAYSKKLLLFDKLNCSIQPGNVYGLLGRNGAGKTTLLKIISGLLFPSSGKCEINDFPANRRNPRSLAEVYFIPEDFELPEVSIIDFANLYSPFYPNYCHASFLEYLNKFGLDTSKKIKKLSFGQKKMVIISFGLALNTKYLIMDEPTNGLDIPSKSIFRKLIAEAISPERSFIISTHQARDLEQLIDPILILEKGKIIFNKSYEEIQETLHFTTVSSQETKGYIYGEKTINGYKAIIENSDQSFSQPNLELLFNAVITNTKYFAEPN